MLVAPLALVGVSEQCEEAVTPATVTTSEAAAVVVKDAVSTCATAAGQFVPSCRQVFFPPLVMAPENTPVVPLKEVAVTDPP